MGYRPGRPPPRRGFQGEGVLAVEALDGAIRLYATPPGAASVPSIRAFLIGDQLLVSADGPVVTRTVDRPSDAEDPFQPILARWADEYAKAITPATPRPAPTGWCSWYHYFAEVTEADIVENLAAISAHQLDVDVVQIDDGWQAAIGDWLTFSNRFSSFPALVRRIRDEGRRVGIWLAPFLVAANSSTAIDHPDWLVTGPDGQPVDAGHNWRQRLYAVDATNPGARAHLLAALGQLRALGVDYFKMDFLYAGALAGTRADGSDPLTAYRSGVALLREAIGPQAYLVGCGAPILPSVGLFDAMRVSPDVAPAYLPARDDPCLPGQWSATMPTVARAFQHGRFWVNDPDCIVARPEIERRAEWASVVERYGGLRVAADRIASLDAWGMETTRRLLADAPPPTPFIQAG